MLSLPNLLTYGRVAAVPVVAALLFWPLDDWARWSALCVFAIAAIRVVAAVTKWPALISWSTVQLAVILSLVTGLVFFLLETRLAAIGAQVEKE